jgi:hypothetical protein
MTERQYTDDEIRTALFLIWEENRQPMMWQVVENETAYEMAQTLLDALAEARNLRGRKYGDLPG